MGNRQNVNPQAQRQKPVAKTQRATGSGKTIQSSTGTGSGKVIDATSGGKSAASTGSMGTVK